MAVTFRIPHELAEGRIIGRQARANPYGAQCFSEMSAWLCFKPEVEEWIAENCKRKSGIRLRPYYPSHDDPMRTGGPEFDRREWWKPNPDGYQVTFQNDKDGILFKMHWL